MLILHSGAHSVDYETLRAVPTPAGTDTHVPIPHHAVVDMVRYSLGFYGHEVVEEHYGLLPDGSNFFGVLTLKSDYGDYVDVVGLRNSHSKKFPIGIAMGASVMVCDNLSILGSHVIRRKHTANAKRELPGLVAEIIEPLRDRRVAQQQMFTRYKETAIPDPIADQAIMALYRRGVINVTRIADVLAAYDAPPHDWGEKTLWRLFNATTFALTGKVAENPQLTQDLHQVIDGVLEAA
jgi:hypothetical protein